MTATTAKKLSGRDACVAAIRAAGTPLTANQIATAVVETGVVPTLGATGKTPKATLGAQIATGAVKGITFRQVGESRPKLYDVLEGVPDSDPQIVQTIKGYFDRPSNTPEPAAEPKAATPAKRTAKAAEPKPEGNQAKPDPKPVSTPRARRGKPAKV